MSISRRAFISGSAAALGVTPAAFGGASPDSLYSPLPNCLVGRGSQVLGEVGYATFDPRVEVDAAAIRHNVSEISRLCALRPVMAVVKNNGYGLGLSKVGPVLDDLDAVAGLAVVKPDQAVALRDAGVRKPILLMGMFSEADAAELVARDIRLAPYVDGAERVLGRIAASQHREVPVHLYLDTGMNRVGVPYRRALSWIEKVVSEPGVRIEGTFTTFTEEDDFDPVQLNRMTDIAQAAQRRNLGLGRLHAASSHGVFHRPGAYLDMVRPGLVLYGAYPAGAIATNKANLVCAIRLKARVVRVERLEPGDSVSYGRNFIAERPTWIATLPVGHADGYPRGAVNGCEVLIGGRLFKVIGAVSASHTVVEVGGRRLVELGDEAVLMGSDNPAVHPNTIAERAGVSIYDVLMHLSSRLPRQIV